MSINQFLMGQADDSFYHTSEYARVAHGRAIGAASTQSFNGRYRVNNNRKVVGNYGESLLANLASHSVKPRAPMQTSAVKHNSPAPLPASRGKTPIPVRPASSTPAAPRPTAFREPPIRGYNPFS